MNRIVSFATRFALVFALLAPSLFSQPDNAAFLKLNTDQVASLTAVANELAKDKYRQDYANWLRNVDLLRLTGQPAVDPPTPPTIRLFDGAIFASIFQAYGSKCVTEASNGRPCGELDYSKAFITQVYPAITQAPPKPPPTQPDNPIGSSMGAGYYGAAPGDTHPDGFIYTNPVGVQFRKYVIPSPFGTRSWYQVIEPVAGLERLQFGGGFFVDAQADHRDQFVDGKLVETPRTFMDARPLSTFDFETARRKLKPRGALRYRDLLYRRPKNPPPLVAAWI